MALRLPGYLRLLLVLYREGGVFVKERRKYGFNMNDVHMLQAYGLVRIAEGMVILNEEGYRWVEREVMELLFPGYTRQYKHEEIDEGVSV